LVCIGPTTAAAARAAGFEPAAVAEPHTVEGLADAIAKLGMTE
jgi:uroporphyrinogen-III synthase